MAVTGPIDGATPRSRQEAHWTTSLTVAEAKRRLIELAFGWEMRLVAESDSEMLFEQGSQLKTRALGAWFADPKRFPKRSIVILRRTDAGTLVDASIYETLGFAMYDAITRRRYEEYFGAWIDVIKRTLPAAAPAASRSLDELEKFATLHEKGILTDDEFATYKKRILG